MADVNQVYPGFLEALRSGLAVYATPTLGYEPHLSDGVFAADAVVYQAGRQLIAHVSFPECGGSSFSVAPTTIRWESP